MKKAQMLGVSLLGLALLGFLAGPGIGVEARQEAAPTPATGGMGSGMMGGQGMMGNEGMMGPGMMGGQGMWPGMMGPGMMGGQGMWPGMGGHAMMAGSGMIGPGMMGGMMCPWMMAPGMMGSYGMLGGPGMMGPGMMGPGMDDMMHGMMGPGNMGIYPATATPITDSGAAQRLATFAATFGPDVQVAEIMSFAGNYYAQLADSNGTPLGEMLVDRYTGAVEPEPGPNMMWNSQWGMQAGGAAQYDEAAAKGIAAGFLAGYLPGAEVLEGTAFPGYYTFDFGRGETEGMLSINAATGEVWVHTWHGPALPDDE